MYLQLVVTIFSAFSILGVLYIRESSMSYDLCSFSLRYSRGTGSCSSSLTSQPSRASRVTIQGEIVEIPFFAVKGPKGTYSHTWKSLKLQSFNRTNPKMLFQASLTFRGFPSSLRGPPRKAPISISKSSLLHSEKLGRVASFALTCPLGLLTGVPEVTMEEERP